MFCVLDNWKLHLLPANDCEFSNIAKYGALRHGWEDGVTWVGASEGNGEKSNLESIWRQKRILEIIYIAVLSLISKFLWCATSEKVWISSAIIHPNVSFSLTLASLPWQSAATNTTGAMRPAAKAKTTVMRSFSIVSPRFAEMCRKH